MQSLFLAAVLVTSNAFNLNDVNKYFVFQNRIENSQKKVVVRLVKYDIYISGFRHNSPHDDGRRLRLYSHLGYVLENIPLYHNRFYNECVEIFLEIEEKIPKSYKCLKANKQQAKEILGLRFSFPENPEIGEKNDVTFFTVDNALSCTDDGQFKTGRMKVAGLYEPNEDIMYVTLSRNYYHWVTVHEYIHASGYSHYCDKDMERENRTFKCAQKAKK